MGLEMRDMMGFNGGFLMVNWVLSFEWL